jgi:uncharacterized protein (DUF433 family)
VASAGPANLRYPEIVTAEQKADIAGVVTVDPAIMHGTPCFTGARVPVQTLLDYIEDGDTLDNFSKDFPTVKHEQAVRFLDLEPRTRSPTQSPTPSSARRPTYRKPGGRGGFSIAKSP